MRVLLFVWDVSMRKCEGDGNAGVAHRGYVVEVSVGEIIWVVHVI